MVCNNHTAMQNRNRFPGPESRCVVLFYREAWIEALQLAYTQYPLIFWRKIRPNNPLENLSSQVRR